MNLVRDRNVGYICVYDESCCSIFYNMRIWDKCFRKMIEIPTLLKKVRQNFNQISRADSTSYPVESASKHDFIKKESKSREYLDRNKLNGD